MQRLFLILINVLFGITIVNAQIFRIFTLDDNLVRSFENGEQSAYTSIVQLKQQIESSDIWTEETKNQYITTIRILSKYYSNQGLYKEQETLLNDAIRIFNQRDSVPNNPYTRFLWVYKMDSQAEIKDYDSALNYGHEALSMYEAVNDYGPDYGMLCLGISSAYLEKGDNLSAKLYADEAHDVAQAASNSDIEKDCITYQTLNINGLVYNKLHQYDKSIECLKKVVDNASPDLLGYTYYMALNNLATTYLLSNRIHEGIDILKKVPEFTPDLRYFKYQNLSIAYSQAGNYSMALEAMKKFNQEALSDEFRIIANFSEVEREAYLIRRNREITGLNNLLANNNSSCIGDAFNINLFTRQISLYVNRYLRSHNDGDTDRVTLNALRQSLVKKNLTASQSDSIRRDIIELEKQILRSDTSFVSNVPFDDWSFKKIISTLKTDEAIVLFCFAPTLKSYTDVEAHYGAFILRQGDKHPHLVQLAEVDSAEEIFYNNTPTEEFISQLYAETNAKKLYNLLWKPMEEFLKGINTVYYSTVGPLSTINFDALIDVKGIRIRDKLNLVLLSSPSEKQNDSDAAKEKRFMAFGSPAFNMNAQEMVENARNYNQFSGEDITYNIRYRGETFRGEWQDIPGTRKEIESITPLIKSNGLHCISYFGKDANEEAFKAISGNSPSILHIATHGFTISSQAQYDNSNFAQSVSGFTPNNSYMLWTGLVFAGGNLTWRGEQIPDGVEDGILTADEISRLDLSNTELVVLSACETARGHIDPIEGVWGLQRAFKQAGVKTILMTLWKVSDSVTAMFMEQFYKHLMRGKTVRQSVKMAQDYLISNGASDPFYWAPFVVLD